MNRIADDDSFDVPMTFTFDPLAFDPKRTLVPLTPIEQLVDGMAIKGLKHVELPQAFLLNDKTIVKKPPIFIEAEKIKEADPVVNSSEAEECSIAHKASTIEVETEQKNDSAVEELSNLLTALTLSKDLEPEVKTSELEVLNPIGQDLNPQVKTNAKVVLAPLNTSTLGQDLKPQIKSDVEEISDRLGALKLDDEVKPKVQTDLSTKLPVINVTKFKPLTEEQISKMNIQQLLETILQCNYLIQHDSRRTNVEFLHTIQLTLDAVVKRLTEMQATTNWAWPSFIAIGLGAIAPMTGAEAILKAISGSMDTLKDIVKANDDSKLTPKHALQTQLQGTQNAMRERGTSEHQELEKTLSQLEGTLKALYDLVMRVCN